jgi:hypothetical protein
MTMRKEYKILILILIFNFGGCCPSDCDKVPKYLNIEGLDIAVKRITNTYSDGSITAISFDTNNFIDFDKLLIELTATGSYFGQNNNYNFGNFFINSAYACKCAGPGHQGSTEQISDIIILSNNPFLSSSNSSDTLSQFFNISGFNGNQFVKPIDLVLFLSTQPSAMSKINLTLKVKPTGSNEHKFTIIYKQTNGEIYEITTPTIKFN